MRFRLIIPESKIFFKYQREFLNLVDGVEYKCISNTVSLFDLALFHSGENIVTQRDYNRANLERTKKFLTRNKIKLISYDFGPMSLRYRSNKFGQFILKEGLLKEREFLVLLENKLRTIRSVYKGAIAIENLPYYKTGAYEEVCEPEFIKYVVEKFKIFLVLDIPHAFISALNLKRDFLEYICSLPLSSVVELHLSRPFIMNRMLIDLHSKLRKTDYKFIYELLQSKQLPKLKYLTVEYYKNYRNIKKQYQELRKLL